MDQYVACHKLGDVLKTSPYSLKWCNKEEFAKVYQKYTGLKLKEILRLLTAINRQYGIVWYHTKGFIVKFSVKGQMPRTKTLIDWGTYYSIFHLDIPKDFFTIGGNHLADSVDAIHPNIYRKNGYDYHRSYKRICLSTNMYYMNMTPFLKAGELHSYIDQVLACVYSNTGNGLFGRFAGKAYQNCKSCGEYINVGQDRCEKCVEAEQADN
jgi:hypothetical protein